MTDMIRADQAAGEALIREIKRATDAIREELNTLEEEVRVLQSGWNGQARLAFDDAHREWATRVSGMYSSLESATVTAAEAQAHLHSAHDAATKI